MARIGHHSLKGPEYRVWPFLIFIRSVRASGELINYNPKCWFREAGAHSRWFEYGLQYLRQGTWDFLKLINSLTYSDCPETLSRMPVVRRTHDLDDRMVQACAQRSIDTVSLIPSLTGSLQGQIPFTAMVPASC